MYFSHLFFSIANIGNPPPPQFATRYEQVFDQMRFLTRFANTVVLQREEVGTYN